MIRTPAKNARPSKKQRTYSRAPMRRNPVNSRITRPVRIPYPYCLPPQIRLTHTYQLSFPITVTTGYGRAVILANGLFAPGPTSYAHQPYYFDQIKALYNQYQVAGSRCAVTWCPDSSDVNTYTIQLMLDDDGTTSVTQNALAERANTQTLVVSRYQAPQAGPKFLNFNAEVVYGKNWLQNSLLTGTPTTNPFSQQWFYINVVNPIAATSSTCTVHVRITYDTIWSELADIQES